MQVADYYILRPFVFDDKSSTDSQTMFELIKIDCKYFAILFRCCIIGVPIGNIDDDYY